MFCDQPVVSRERCEKHYRIWLRESDGPRCKAEGCELRAMDTGRCEKHAARFKSYGDDTVVQRRGSNRNLDNPSYKAVHKWLAIDRGPAKDYPCAHCDVPAIHWAYNFSDPSPLIDPRYGSPYSADTDRYIPLCKRCHLQFDTQTVHLVSAGNVWRIVAA